MTNRPRFRQLPQYVALGAKRDVWQYILDHATGDGDDGHHWAYFRVATLPDAIEEAYGRRYHRGTISRALRDLSDERYITYRPGTRGQVSMARPEFEDPHDPVGEGSS